MSFEPCSCMEAKYAVLGVSHDGGSGILNWFDNEIAAYRFRNDINNRGGKCRVEKITKDTNEFLQDKKKEIMQLIFS